MTKTDRGWVIGIILWLVLVFAYSWVFWPWPFIDRIGAAFLCGIGTVLFVSILFAACAAAEWWIKRGKDE